MSAERRKYYPYVLIKDAVIFPAEKVPLVLEGSEIVGSVKKAIDDGGLVVVVFSKNKEISDIGVLSRVLQHWNLSPTAMGIIIEGLDRVEIVRVYEKKNIQEAEVIELEAKKEETTELEAITRIVFDKFKEMVRLEGIMPLVAIEEMQKNRISPDKVSNVVSSSLKLDFQEKLELLEIVEIGKRLNILNLKLSKELDILKAEKRIQREVEKEVGKSQKEFILREQIKAIEKELGIFEEQKEYDDLEDKIKKSLMPKDAEDTALKELRRLRGMPGISAEAPYIRAYLDWLSELPWGKRSATVLDLKKARKVLDADHYGLDKVKERVLEYLAVQKLTGGKGSATIMCFVGPPGTGKTSVGKSIARALGRKFFRLSLGGIHDEAEIRGHRRTYVGALPGRIIQGIKTAGTINPVFMLDEIDKLSVDFRGDPSAALLEVLDPEQNNSFSDHYLEVPFDLSEVIFITTANILDTIPPTLSDRMEIIEFSGYTDDEKAQIAKKFLIPKVFTASGLAALDLAIDDKTILKIINKYTREAGVRDLERKISEIARKIARKMAENGDGRAIIITEQNLSDYLGPEDYHITVREEEDEIGVSTGIAWTPAGGEIIFIETSLAPGKGDLTLTGQLGKTMQESAKAAFSYVRSRAKELGIDTDFYQKSDVHIHVPSGAIPKDGPSAGIAIAVSLASILTGKKVKKEIALTGEMTLLGKILEVGGIKEKILAAHRAGVGIVIMPKGNEKNLADVPEEVRRKMKFILVDNVDEVFKNALK